MAFSPSGGGPPGSEVAHFSDNLKGFVLAVASSLFIGSSFIFKKKGLRRSGSCGGGAAVGGHGYLREPLWWLGLVTMIVGEISNFVAYTFAPAVLVTPLGALSIIVSSILAHFLLEEKLKKMGVWGCVLCIVGSTVIVLHAPEERTPGSVDEIWNLAIQPEFLLYTAAVVAASLVLMLHYSPLYGQTNILIDLGICSMIGSLTVMSIKAIGIAIKLTVEGTNQAGRFQAWVFAMVAATCIIIQLNYLNKVVLIFYVLTASWMIFFGFVAFLTGTGYLQHRGGFSIYYVMFTTFTIAASSIMFKDWSGQKASDIASVFCGFITVLAGTTLCILQRSQTHSLQQVPPSLSLSLSPSIYLSIYIYI
ncbi:unnamed protein product [Spirodela intermedia]|uniref:Probable magnesium transporter n=1 Tax=Spirodela intermedia TaxID=51605 RepID=A0A7I8JE77_SPIIN|nr:unnamed protein product [Spirodela intermedia]CAA6668417.1 unnamed protein product [Spirodela intermedia]